MMAARTVPAGSETGLEGSSITTTQKSRRIRPIDFFRPWNLYNKKRESKIHPRTSSPTGSTSSTSSSHHTARTEDQAHRVSPENIANLWIKMGSKQQAAKKNQPPASSLLEEECSGNSPVRESTTRDVSQSTKISDPPVQVRPRPPPATECNPEEQGTKQKSSLFQHQHPGPSSRTKIMSRSGSKQDHVDWKSAVDPKTGRVYYYNKKTRVSQWKKPLELASDTEREEMIQQEQQQREFFETMEANILKNMHSLSLMENAIQAETAIKSEESIQKASIPKPSGMIRTISTMDENVLKDLVQGLPSHHYVGSTLRAIEEESQVLSIQQELLQLRGSSTSLSEELDRAGTDFLTEKESRALEQLADITFQMSMQDLDTDESISTTSPVSFQFDRDEQFSEPSITDAKPAGLDKNSRRNTCGTMYLSSTIAAPDKDGLIKCVCGVYRAHIVQASQESSFENDQFTVFNDENKIQSVPVIPTLDEITAFYRDVFRRSQMEADCIIVSLVFVERLIKVTGARLRPRACNWRSILFSCMVLSSKVNDDLSMWNVDFSQTCPSGVKFSLKRINQLEIATLSTLNFKVKVKASEYAKYYFLLRSMLIKSGLGGDDAIGANPLDVQGAKRLEHLSSQYQLTAQADPDKLPLSFGGRSKSMSSAGFSFEAFAPKSSSSDHRTQANLEQVVRM